MAEKVIVEELLRLTGRLADIVKANSKEIVGGKELAKVIFDRDSYGDCEFSRICRNVERIIGRRK